MVRRLLFAAGVVVAVSAPAQAKLMTAQELLWACEGKFVNEAKRIMGMIQCASYISGIIDGVTVAGMFAQKRPLFCIPRQGIANDQARLVFIKWANGHPSKLHNRARTSVIIAMAKAFPRKMRR